MKKNVKHSIIAAIIIILAIFCYFFKPIIISGDSMYPTLKNHQLIIACRRFSIIQNNDIIIFKKDDSLVVKRVLAVKDDTVELKNNSVYVNGIQIEPFTYKGEYKKYNLNNDEFFVIGDNYAVSYDSRDYGLINKKQVIALLNK